jgi:AcrR family transcriptional regulator
MTSPAPVVPSPERILRKALALFSEKGYDATSVREICEAAAITKPTLYHFYGSKEGVYRTLVEGTLEEYRRGIREVMDAPGTLPERLQAVVRGHFGYTRENPSLVRFLFGLIHNPPSSAPSTDFHAYYAQVLDTIGERIDAAVARGEIEAGPRDVRLLVFMGAISEALHGFLIAGRPDLTPELADSLVATVLGGWRSSPKEG